MLPRDFHHAGVHVDTDGAYTGRLEQHPRQLSQKPQPDDGARLSQPQVRLPDTLKRDGAKGIVGRLFEVCVRVQFHAKVFGNAHNFSVGGGQPSAGHFVPDVES